MILLNYSVAQNLEYVATWNGFGLQSLVRRQTPFLSLLFTFMLILLSQITQDPREGLKAAKTRKPGNYAPMPKIDPKL